MSRITHGILLTRVFLSYLRKREICKYYPTRLWIEPTNRCNLKCKMCLNKDLPSSAFGFMEMETFRKIADELSHHSYDIYLHHRGESLLHPELPEMITYAHSRGIKTRLHTNATLLNEEKSERIIDAGLDFLSFSFDGYEKSEYESIRINATYEKTIENIKRFLTIKKKKGVSHPYVTFTVIEFRDHSPKERAEFLKQFSGLPLDAVRIRKPHNWGGEFHEASGNDNKDVFLPCTFPWYSLTIFWDGSVYPCPQDFFGKLKLGNVKESTIAEIWNSSQLRNIRNHMRKDKVEHLVPCKECDRIHRRGFLGVPVEGIKPFLKDNLF